MQITDSIADMLTRIRNANSAKHDTVKIPASNMKKAIAQILLDEGYIKGFKVEDDGKQGVIEIALKYGPNKSQVITGFAQSFQARSAYIYQLRGYAQSHEGSRYRYPLNQQGHYDGQGCSQGQCRRRSPCIYLVRRCCKCHA